LIIALIGENNCGKTTIANILAQLVVEPTKTVEELFDCSTVKINTNKVKVLSFADPVSEIFKNLTNTAYHTLTRDQKEICRPLYIKFAEGMKDIFGKDIWAKKIIQIIEESNNLNIIIDDLRFDIELCLLKGYYKELKLVNVNGGLPHFNHITPFANIENDLVDKTFLVKQLKQLLNLPLG